MTGFSPQFWMLFLAVMAVGVGNLVLLGLIVRELITLSFRLSRIDVLTLQSALDGETTQNAQRTREPVGSTGVSGT